MTIATWYTGTHTEFLRNKLAKVGHSVLAEYMREQGYQFRYAYYVCFNKLPHEVKRNEWPIR